MAVDTHTIVNPSITIGTVSPVELKCYGEMVSLTAEDKLASVSTFCFPDGEKPGRTVWRFKAQIKQSFGTDGAWTKLKPLAKTKQTVIIKPLDAVKSTDNPWATFDIYVPTISFLDGSGDEASEFEWDVVVIGEPAFATA